MIDYNPSATKIYYSKDYGQFKMITGNRQLNEQKIKRIIADINRGNDMLPYYPIQVKEAKGRLEIIDGQHRFYICKKLKRPVHFILVKEDKSLPDIARINSNVGKWKSGDFINCYVSHGNNHYKTLQEYLDRYHISLNVSLMLLTKGNPGVEGMSHGLTEQFQNGKIEVTELEKATEIANHCERFGFFPHWRSRSFVIAIYRVLKAELVKIEDLVAAAKKRPEMLTQQGNYKSYINQLEQIINVGKQKRILLT